MTSGTSTDASSGSSTDTDTNGGETGHSHVCRDTGREQGLIGTYDIWLCRQSFREMAHEMGFRKYD